MAITVTSPQATVGFIKNAVSADASGTEEILAGTAGAGNICVFCQGTIE
jgi:hypothetical protein